MEIIRKEDQKISKWSGGTTTELFIYPKDAVYSERNFKWRLSSAEVLLEESDFTHLPGISRIIMIINGELQLQHEGHYNKVLKPFQQDSFSGDWTTKSIGKVRDFNLMMRESCKGKLETISLKSGEGMSISFHGDTEEEKTFHEISETFYIVEGSVEILNDDNERIKLYEGDMALISKGLNESREQFKIYNINEKESKIIKSVILY